MALPSKEDLTLKSTPANEVILGLAPSVIPGIGSYSSVAGSISGQATKPSVDHNNALMNLIPGVAAHRISNRLKLQILKQKKKHKVDGMSQLTAENLGSFVPLLLLGGLGAGIGALTGEPGTRKDRALKGMSIGVGVSTLSKAIGAVAAWIRRRRTEREQVAHDRDKSNIAKDILIPGVASYNKFKRLGRSVGDSE